MDAGESMTAQVYPEPTVGALIFNSDGRLLLLRSHKWRGAYVIPGGHVELGESLSAALVREVKEETGLDISAIEFVCFQEFIHDEAFWERKHFIFFDFACRADSTEVQLNSESEEYTWVALNELPRLQVDLYTLRAIRAYEKKRAGQSAPWSP